nr:unnamed protein product [Callosobruchus chinensis]
MSWSGPSQVQMRIQLNISGTCLS